MTAKKIPFCTDEELLDELKKLGYNDVSPDVLEIMKDDLSQLITKDTGQSLHSKRSVSGNEKESTIVSNSTKYRYSQKQFHRATRNLSESEKPLPPNVVAEHEKKYSDVLASNNEIPKTASFEKYKNTFKNYKAGKYRKNDSLTVDNIKEKLSAEILDEPSSEADYSEELHGVTNEQYQSKKLGTKGDVLASNGEIPKTTLEKYKNTFKNYKAGNYQKNGSISFDNMKEKLSAEILDEPSSEADYSEEPTVTNKQYQSKRFGPKGEKESHTDLKQSYSQKQNPRLQRTFSDANKSSVSEVSLENSLPDMLSSSDDVSRVSAFDRYKNTFQSYKRNNYAKKHENILPESNKKQESFPESNQNITSETDYRSSLSSISSDPNKIKRKVLRHRDGKPVITEEFLDIPSIFNSSYPETLTLDNSKSFSSDDLSWKSNSSTGSISALSPDASVTPRSTFSLSSTRSLHSRVVNPRKKKNDPVAMYNYYKKFWNEFKPPGEKTHDKIRWAVRDKMLDYNM